MPTANQFDFLIEYVLELLKANGFADLSEAQKNVYVPELLSRLEQRLGLELAPKLSSAGKDKLALLMSKPDTDGAAWKNFWYSEISNFEDELRRILAAFAEEVRQILQPK